MGDSIVNKLLHAPLTTLKSPPPDFENEALVVATRLLFRTWDARLIESVIIPATEDRPRPRTTLATLPGYRNEHAGEVLSLTRALPWWRFRTPKRAGAGQRRR